MPALQNEAKEIYGPAASNVELDQKKRTGTNLHSGIKRSPGRNNTPIARRTSVVGNGSSFWKQQSKKGYMRVFSTAVGPLGLKLLHRRQTPERKSPFPASLGEYFWPPLTDPGFFQTGCFPPIPQ